MDLDNLFVSDLLDTLVGATDDRSTTQAVGEEGDEPEPPQDTTTQALGEEGEQPEDTGDTGIGPEPVVTTQSLGEEGDQPEDTEIEPGPDGSDAPVDHGIWAGEDGDGGGCVIEVDDTTEPEECEPADEEEPAEEVAPSEADDPLACW